MDKQRVDTGPGSHSASHLTRRDALKLIGVGVAGVLAAACGGGGGSTRGIDSGSASGSPSGSQGTTDFSARFAEYEAAPEPNGDLSKVVWPDFVTDAGSEAKTLYEFQIQNGELMRYMPCFCGCHLSDGHRNNRDCYVEAVNADGSVVLDSMAPT